MKKIKEVLLIVVNLAFFCGILFVTPYILNRVMVFYGIEEIKTSSVSEPINIYCVASSVEISGELFGNYILCSGSISNIEYYVFYEEVENATKKYTKYEKDICLIHDTLMEDEQSYIVLTSNWRGKVTQVDIFVPDGSVEQHIDLSL